MDTRQISIIVPTLNERLNVTNLVRRFDVAFKQAGIEYEIVFIDDHSIDGTQDIIQELSKIYPVFLYVKKGIRGKAHSILEGFQHVRHPYVAMIDADLQYPPEEIPAMAEKLQHGCDIVVANRASHKTHFIRRAVSHVFNFIFSRLLHDLHCDVQSGLKVFRRKIIDEVKIDPSPWTFDLEFLLQAKNYGYVIGNHDIVFAEREKGESKIVLWKAIWEIGSNALKLKFKGRQPLLLRPENTENMLGAGMAHGKQRFITHTTLHHHFSAVRTFSFWQNVALGLIGILFAIGLLAYPLEAIIALVAVLSFIYFVDVFFNLFLVLRSLKRPPEIMSSQKELKNLDDSSLPVYSILCPMYREANMLPGFIKAISNLEWPKNKLDVLLLLEENDQETVASAQAMNLPEFVRIIVVPHSMPKTKPKACNYGLAHARGEYVVIYDAEDIPDPLQLKKAYLGFQKSPGTVRCLQAKLNYFNPHHNFLTRLFTAEYSLWFDVTLPGLQSVNTSIPLGGTSNHFRAKDLLELEGWDPFNVTEDCDLGIRIFKRGYRTAIIDSVTLEEANSRFGNWLRQRSRWIKGYMQTYLVHMRNPIKFFRENGVHAFLFQMVVGGKLAFIFINPFLWIATIAYFALNKYVGATIEALYPGAVFYMAVISLVAGNFLAMYYYMLGCAKRGHWPVIKYVFLVPVYWLMVSVAGFIALYQLFAKPHYWEKTQHGLHLAEKKRYRDFFPAAIFAPAYRIFKNKFAGKNTLGSLMGRCRNACGALEKKIPSFVPESLTRFVFSSKGIIMLAIIISNVLNFAFNAFLSRALTYPQLALVIFVSTLWYVATIFIGGLSNTVNHRTSYLVAQKGEGAAISFLRWTLKRSTLLVVGFSLIWLAAAPVLAKFFQVQSIFVLILFTPALLFGLLSSAYKGFITGHLRFTWSAVIIVTETLAKLFLAFAFTAFGKGEWVYLSIPLSLMMSALAGGIFMRRMPRQPLTETNNRNYFPSRFFLSSIFTNISSIIFLSVDILLVKHFFDSEIAGQYSILSLSGKMVYFLGTLPLVFMVPYVSRQEGLRQSSKRIFHVIFLGVSALAVIGMLAFGLFGFITVPFLFGAKAAAIVAWLPVYSFSIGIFTLANTIVLYHLAKRNYLFSWVSMGSSAAFIAGVWLSHGNLAQVVRVFFFVSLVNFAAIGALHYFESSLPYLKRGLRDLWGIFINGLPKAQPRVSTGKRILIFNWRDTTHAYAGGAEVYVQQIAKIWVAQGNHVTVFCGNDGKQSRYETIDGIDIVRRGGFYLVYLWAFLYYMFRFRGKYDVIIDCQNGVPFFTPLYAKERVYCLMHHVHQEVFFRHLAKPLAVFASFLEKDLMPLVYRKVKFITVSDSSKDEMLKLGLGEAGIQVIHNGAHLDEFIIGERDSRPTALYLGRLKAYKSVDILLRSFRQVLEKQPDAQLIVAGTGDAENYLKDLAQGLGLTEQQVIFKGRVSEKEKINLLQKAWVAVNPSLMEGWGIVVIEANACGTPVIASDVPGLRDSVRNFKSGYLVPYGDVDGFAREILNIFQDTQLREKMSKDARRWAENFAWEKSSERFFAAINNN